MIVKIETNLGVIPKDKLTLREDGNIFTSYLPNMVDGKYVPDMDAEAKAEKESALVNANTEYENQVKALTTGIPESEKLTWTKQEQEARAYLADSSAVTPLLDGIVASRGVDKDYLVLKVIEKADMYATTIGYLIGYRQAVENTLTQTSGASKLDVPTGL